MHRILPSLIVLLLAVPARAADNGQPVSWLPQLPGERVVQHPDGVLEITGEAGPTQTMLITLEKPAVPSHHYRLVGRVKYANVQGVGHVEMWNYFAGGKAFFTKTLADSGPMGHLTGTADWRDVDLPFFSEPEMLPEKITVALVLPQGGKVFLTPMRLTTAATSTFFDGWLGAALGTTVGLIGACIGILAAIPRTRRVALWILWACIPSGVALVIVGLVMLALGQAYGLWYPFVLCGGILAVVSASVVAPVKRQLAQDEVRRMNALDAGM